MLRRKNFGDYTAADFAEAQQLMARLRATAPMRRSRRRRPARWRRGHRPDIRATVRRALRTGGEPVRRAWYAPSLQPRRLVLLCDVSGSMDLYSRALLRFMHAAVAGRRRVEAFAMGTRLTRLTRELSSRDPDQALKRAGVAVADGPEALDWVIACVPTTTAGACAEHPGRSGSHPLRWLGARRSNRHRRPDGTPVAGGLPGGVVNPLKASPGYAPLARGMAAALPYIDQLVDGHNLNALEELVEIVSR